MYIIVKFPYKKEEVISLYNAYYSPYMCCKCCRLWMQYYDSYLNTLPKPFANLDGSRQSNVRKPAISTPPIPNWKAWKEHAEKLGGQWVEEGNEIWENILEETKNAENILRSIIGSFKPCIPPEGYSCIEYKVVEKLPVFGALHQDIIIRVCYPTRIVTEVEEVLPKWLESCLKKAAEKAGKAFISALVLTAWGAFAASIEAGIYAAIDVFGKSLRKDLETLQEKAEVDIKELIPSIYMRKHSLYIPYGNTCFPMYKNYGQSSE